MPSLNNSAATAVRPSPAGRRLAAAWLAGEIARGEVIYEIWPTLDADPAPATIDGYLAALPGDVARDVVAALRRAAAADPKDLFDFDLHGKATPARVRPESLAAARAWAAAHPG